MDDFNLANSPIRILLVEDNPLDADLFRSYLALANMAMPHVAVAERLAEAIRLVQAEEFDVIFLDYKLPDSEGVESLARLKAKIPHVPIVVLTGLDDDQKGLDMVLHGAQDYLVKDRVNESILWRVLRYSIARKLTEARQREFEERLREAQRAESLARLAGGIAHSYNNLLTSIMGNTSLVLGNIAQTDPNREFLREIQKAAKRAAVLTNQMLTYSGQCRGTLAPVELGEFVTRMAPFLRTVREGDGPISYGVEPKVFVQADVAQLQQLLVNLVENAQEAVAEQTRRGIPGRVEVAVSTVEITQTRVLSGPGEHGTLTPGTYARIAVTDTGTGMDEATLLKAFDPFFSTKFTGRGLGLASVLGIVRGHRGVLHVRSEVGKGTTFLILLPVLAATDIPGEEEESSSAPLDGRGLMLVADEESLVATVTRKILERYGYTVQPAANPTSIAKLVARHRGEIICILVDCGMLKDPATFVRDTLEQAPNSGILLTSDSEELPLDLSPFAGRVAYLRKPYLPRELMHRVQSISGCGGGQPDA